MNQKSNFLEYIPPMGIYETLYKFQDVFGSYMGEKNTHPWSQGFPLTSKIPNGPEMPETDSKDSKFSSWGTIPILDLVSR